MICFRLIYIEFRLTIVHSTLNPVIYSFLSYGYRNRLALLWKRFSKNERFQFCECTLLEQVYCKLLKRSFARSSIILWVDLLAMRHGLQTEAIRKQRTIVQYLKKVEKIFFNPIYFRWQRDLLEIIESSYVEKSIVKKHLYYEQFYRSLESLK